MSSCSSCGSCTKYFETPSGKCDYCDCPYADHVKPVRRESSGLDTMHTQGIPQQPMGYQQMPTNQMPYNPTGYQGLANYVTGIPLSPVSPMHQAALMQQGQFNPVNNPFYSQQNPFQQQFAPYGGMPMLPPSPQAAPYVGTSCSSCGALLSAANREMLCAVCLRNKPPSACTKCKTGSANPGFSWCQACFESDDKCRNCNKNVPNQGYKWCEACYKGQGQTRLSDCGPAVETAVSPQNACPACGKQRHFDMKEKKLFDFCGQTCAQQHYTARGALKLDTQDEDFAAIASVFKEKWNPKKGACPAITAIFRVRPTGGDAKLEAYRKTLRSGSNTIEYYFHGCKITCDLLSSKALCSQADCTICQVSRHGFDIKKVGTNVAFTRFGRGLYFAPESSKCHDYTLGTPACGYRAMLYVKCAPGFKQVEFKDNQQRTAPDKAYNSLYGHAGASLNYDELCLYTDQACVPDCIIIYSRDGVDRRCN